MSLTSATIHFGPISQSDWADLVVLIEEASPHIGLLAPSDRLYSKKLRRLALALAEVDSYTYGQETGVVEANFVDLRDGRELLKREGLDELLRSYGIGYDLDDSGDDQGRDGAIESWRPAMGEKVLVRYTTASGRPVVTAADMARFVKEAVSDFDPNRAVAAAVAEHLQGPTPLAELPMPDPPAATDAPEKPTRPASVAEAMNRR